MKWARMLALAVGAVMCVTMSLMGSSEAKAVAPTSAAGNKKQGNPGVKKTKKEKNNECGSKDLCLWAKDKQSQKQNLSNLKNLANLKFDKFNEAKQKELGEAWSPLWSQILNCSRSKNKKQCDATITKNQTVYLEPFYQLREELNVLSKNISLCHKKITLDVSQDQLKEMIRIIENCSNHSSPQRPKRRDVELSLSEKDRSEFCPRANAVLKNFQTLAQCVVNTSCRTPKSGTKTTLSQKPTSGPKPDSSPKPELSPKPKKSTQQPGVTRKPQTGKRTTVGQQ